MTAKTVPMSTTSLKLPEALKQRVLAESERKGISPHAFMVGAIEQAASAAEHRAAFIAEAIDAREDMMASGLDSSSARGRLFVRSTNLVS
jgi:predicted transcriptional regulator